MTGHAQRRFFLYGAMISSLLAQPAKLLAHPVTYRAAVAPSLDTGAHTRLVASKSEESNSAPKRICHPKQGIQEQGIWAQAAFGILVVPATSGATNSMAGVKLGYKWHRFVLAAALDFHYFHWANDENSTKEDDFSLAIGPAVEFLAARKGHLGFHVSAEIQFLLSRSKMERPYGGYSGTAYGFDLTVGTGVRYYVYGVFGIGVEFGVDMGYLRRDSHNTFDLGPYGIVSTAVIW